MQLAAKHGIAHAKTVAGAVRMFLAFLASTGRVDAMLSHAVPTIAEWKKSGIPRHIPPQQVELLLAACAGESQMDRRDRAILLLLARLAMRAGDVSGLRRADIDWAEGRIRVSGKSRREVWLPLPQDVGDALAAYLLHARPAIDTPQVFVTTRAPMGPISRWIVSQVVSRALRRSGVDAPSHGAHLLRHTAAVAMLKQGANLVQIGSVLRHKSIETTAHYAKVDADSLAEVALPWPRIPSVSEPEPPPAPPLRVDDVRRIAQPWPEVTAC